MNNRMTQKKVSGSAMVAQPGRSMFQSRPFLADMIVQRYPSPAPDMRHEIPERYSLSAPHAPLDNSVSLPQVAVESSRSRTSGHSFLSISRNTERVGQSNRTGLPDGLKAGIENLSGLSMDDVRVHYNSSRPAQFRALAYTQGSDIYMGFGQQKYLAHEAWHAVQQKQGRVKPTLLVKGAAINDDEALEREADSMGNSAQQQGSAENGLGLNSTSSSSAQAITGSSFPIQRVVVDDKGNEVDIAAVTQFLNDNHLETTMSKGDLIGELESYKENEGNTVGILDFLSEIGAIESHKDPEQSMPSEEELKKIQKRKGSAPKSIRNEVYGPGNVLRKTPSGGGEIFTCGDCGKDLIVDKKTKHERGFSTKNSGRGQQPPVCHSDERPADYTINALEEIAAEESSIQDRTSLRTNTIFQRIRDNNVWEFGRTGLYPGHTTCNSKKMDKKWDSLPKITKKEYKSDLKELLKKTGDYDKLKKL